MASVKFNRGNYGVSLTGQDNALSFLRKTSAGAADYGYLYLGENLVATKYLAELDTTGLTVASASADKILGFGWDSTNSKSVMNTITLTKAAGVSTQGYTPSDTDLMTASAVASYVSTQIANNDIYHKSGTSGTSSDGWSGWKYTADAYKGSTLLTNSTTPLASAYELSFTLPVANSFSASDDTHLVTPKTIADYFAGLAGGMRYCGAATSTTLPTGTGTLAPYKSGDVFIAAPASGDTTLAALGIEAGDMIVLNSTYTSGSALSATNCEVYERNLDGAVTKASDLTENAVILGAGTSSIKSLANGTEGKMLQMGSSAPAWADYIYDTVALKSNTIDTIQVTRHTNGTAGTPTDIQIQAVNIKQTVTSASEDRPILVTAAASPTSGNAAEVNYETSVKINASTGTVKATEVSLTNGNTTINVYETLTWQTLS